MEKLNIPVALVCVALLFACNGPSPEPAASVHKDSVHVSAQDAFGRALETMLNSYDSLKMGLAQSSARLADLTAARMIDLCDSIPLKELKADSSTVSEVRTYQLSLSSELHGLMGEKELEEKRKAFELVNDELQGLLRVVKYNRHPINKAG